MDCPYCGMGLSHHDSYGFFASHQTGEKIGDIFKCPNAEGFEDENCAREHDPDFTENWEELVCQSAVHYVSGSFYTDKLGNLQEGYPC